MMMIALLLALQTPANPPPDIAIGVSVRARSVTIEKKGEAELNVSASPDGGSDVAVRAPESDGRRRLRNVEVEVRGEARIADPKQAADDNGAVGAEGQQTQ